MIPYLVYDVFTDAPFGGNPLAVFPDASAIPEAALPRIAREFNFSETTFVYPPADPAHTARVRIFTPAVELPFAGHPTIGTAVALHDLGGPARMVLELGVGPLPAAVRDGAAEFTTRVPLTRGEARTCETVAGLVGLPAAAIRRDRHDPLSCGVGVRFLVAELDGAEALAAAVPDTAAFRAAAGPDEALRLALLLYVRDGAQVRARMFSPLSGIVEDPATGSAAAALAALLAELGGQPVDLDIAQGVEMGRPSRIRAAAGPGGVTVSGRAVRVMEGRLTARL